MKRTVILLLVCLSQGVFAQKHWKAAFPHQGFSLQFAGSVGFLSAGYYHRTKGERLELSAIYGYTPEAFGGEIHSVSLKFNYIPFHFKLGEHFLIEPIQGGAFVAQNFGKNLYVLWPEKYPHRYYWWPNSLRQHVFLSSQLSFIPKKGAFEKFSVYFEANTNDLYLYSYLPNRGTITLYDIVFFGAGVKASLR